MSVNIDKSLWRLTTSNGIKVKLIDRSGGFSRGDAEGTEIYIIKAEDLLQFVELGLPTPIFEAGVVYPGRAVMFGIPSLIVENITWKGLVEGVPIDPFGQDPGAPEGTYQDDIEVTVKYKPREKAKDGDDSDPNDPTSFLQISSRASGEFIAPPITGNARWWKWSPIFGPGFNPDIIGWEFIDAGEVTEADIPSTVLSSLTEWTVSWPQIPHDYFYDAILPRLRATRGTVNKFTVGLLHNPPPDTLLFNGWSTNEEYLWDLSSVRKPPISLDMSFVEKNFLSPDAALGNIQVTWQHIYRPGKGWQVIILDGVEGDSTVGHGLYTETNHNLIWVP